jgi:Uma2 family endonuclease
MATQISETAPEYDVTYEQWLEAAPESRMSEWVKGKVIDFMPPTERHQDLILWLGMLMTRFLRFKALGKVIIAPFEMKLVAIPSSREPDVLVVLENNRPRLDGKRLNGPADVAIEIISPDSVSRDRREKLEEYAAVGIPEYWLIDPRLGRFSFKLYRLTAERSYEEIAPRPDGKIESAVLSGFIVDPAWLEQDPLPDEIDVFRAMTSHDQE